MPEAPLSQGVGYGMLVGVGLAFAFGAAFVTRMLKIYANEDNKHSEMFMTANRSVGTGLTVTAVISSWAWSTALLSSTAFGYLFGVAGPLWYGAGNIVQIGLFSVLAIQTKLKIPAAHTLLEIVRVRYGTVAHCVWIFLCLANNIVAVSNMLVGASFAVNALTGVHIVAATLLLPLGVVFYTVLGGIKATFITDYLHSFILLLLIVIFSVRVFTSGIVDSPGQLYDMIVEASKKAPMASNQDGSYLTVHSPLAARFALSQLLGNFGLCIMDTGFWQKAFAADISAAVPGYLLGAVGYFSIPWTLGTIIGVGGIAFQYVPKFPVKPMSASDINNGLILPYTAQAILGTGGAGAVLTMIFMAVTSTTSAQLIAVSSIVSFDIFKTYIKPHAKDHEIIRVAHLGVIGFALFAGGFSIMLYYIGLSLAWLDYFLGVVTCPGIIPTVLTVLWKGQTKTAAIVSPVLGMITGFAVWLGATKALYGVVNVDTSGSQLSCMYGVIASFVSPAIYTVTISLIKPESFDWNKFFEVELITDDLNADEIEANRRSQALSPAMIKKMKKMSKLAAIAGVSMFVGVWVIWPYAMYGSRYVFSKKFFTGWIVMCIIYAFFTFFLVTFYPLWDGRHQLKVIILGLVGKKSPVRGKSLEHEHIGEEPAFLEPRDTETKDMMVSDKEEIMEK
ncbi:hypothetical protein AYL99_08357 [Fonsecaea erecta]|uniref:Urea active transporter n=1 Tax=Fonsecaea erecta TaxID=1367422 RepID=A0A178ZCX6_9EURO|nr:hypothetical protein AYL99_08357 [Fonsecaea erecta]OAP57619.1 hypothetical protein AYL99_08357 [Fonsecaea erecta]